MSVLARGFSSAVSAVTGSGGQFLGVFFFCLVSVCFFLFGFRLCAVPIVALSCASLVRFF